MRGGLRVLGYFRKHSYLWKKKSRRYSKVRGFLGQLAIILTIKFIAINFKMKIKNKK